MTHDEYLSELLTIVTNLGLIPCDIGRYQNEVNQDDSVPVIHRLIPVWSANQASHELCHGWECDQRSIWWSDFLLNQGERRTAFMREIRVHGLQAGLEISVGRNNDNFYKRATDVWIDALSEKYGNPETDIVWNEFYQYRQLAIKEGLSGLHQNWVKKLVDKPFVS